MLPAVGFWLGFALLFKHREGHGTVAMVSSFFTAIIWAWIVLAAWAADVGDASFTFD